ncbi:hypothetical protein HC02_19265, partial [Vibrio parahaemolyticus]
MPNKMKKLFVIALNLVILGGAAWLGYQKFEEYLITHGHAMAKYARTSSRSHRECLANCECSVQDNQEETAITV